MARSVRRRGGLFVLIGILSILGVTFVAGVYAGRISMARSTVKLARVTEADTARRTPSRGAKLPEAPSPQLTFYRELTAPLTAPPPPPKPAKAVPPLLSPPAAATARPGERADMIAATTTPQTAGSTASRFTVQVAAYRVRPQAEALRESLASAGHDARVVEVDAHGPVYRVQV